MPMDVSLSDSKCWNGGQKLVAKNDGKRYVHFFGTRLDFFKKRVKKKLFIVKVFFFEELTLIRS